MSKIVGLVFKDEPKTPKPKDTESAGKPTPPKTAKGK